MNAQFSDDRAPADVATLRIPPHAIDAEQAVLGGLMLAPESLAKISDWLTEADFYRADHRMVYRAVSTLIARGAPVDPVTMMDWFESNDMAGLIGGVGYLVELSDATASCANIVAYAEIVVEKSRLRAVIETGTRLAEAAWAKGADSQTLVTTAAHELTVMRTSTLHGGLEPVKVGMRQLQAEIMARYKRGPGLIGEPWPWKDLNDATNGLRNGVLYVVGARPSMGKSIFGLQTAVFNALRGKRTAFFSVEMGAAECLARAIACVGNLPHSWVEHPTDSHPDAEFFWHRFTDTTQLLLDSPLLIDETPALSGRQMIARARRAHLQDPLRLIVIDHMHDMLVDARNARFDYGEITQLGKTMAKEFRCPVILLAQLNRQLASRGDKRPTMTDLRESGEIEQKADVILFLHREEYHDKNTHLQGVVEVIPAKGRNIKTGETIYLQNAFSEMRMMDWVGPLPVPSISEYVPKPKRGFPA